MKEDKIIKPFFSHDYTPLEDKNLLKLDIAMGNEGYGLYWKIVEFMHQNDFLINEENLLAYKFRTDVEKIHTIMTEFDLFRTEGNFYISDRILRNLNFVEKRNEEKSIAAQVRWLLASFNKTYEEFFGEKPILNSTEIESLKKYNKQIPDLKEKLRDILFTLKNLKFKDIPNFKPCANWLLKGNNLAKLVNGEFGKLQHKPTEKELKEEQRRLTEIHRKKNEPSELDLKIQSCCSKTEALNIISNAFTGKKPTFVKGKLFLIPTLRPLAEKFDITDKEIVEYLNGEE